MKKKKIRAPHLGVTGEFFETPKAPVPEGGKRPFQVANVVGEVDMTPQALRPLRPFRSMVLRVPPGLSNESQIVLQCLFLCFEKAKTVSEGLIGDLLWGFAQASPPIPPALSIKGIDDLRKAGYLKLQAPDNSFIDFSSDVIEKAWVRYQPSLLDMVYEGSLQ